ncbi:hypothetical protein [Azospirillum canadense]|uniref:hypothetical protein n=1 Tax=Azospirillum canadense TaxID=403962 RepID=UPI002227E955|nr:hypothetical protein [Azospirillum canadense]MCW2240646.1 hypothetical protein [Azospirillum canadense]
MPKPVLDTLGNLPETHKLYGGCFHCQRTFEVDKAVLIARLGPDCSTLTALKKVTCRECGRPAQVVRGHAGGEGKRD